MRNSIRNFIHYQCELMPDGPVKIYSYEDGADQSNCPDGYTKQDEILLRTGPENWLFWVVDCYQFYLWFLSSPQRWGSPRPDQVEFVKFVMEHPGIFVRRNHRYQLEEKNIPKINKHLIGKEFVGIRHKNKNHGLDDEYRYR